MSDKALRGISVRRRMPYLTQSAFGVTFTQESGAQVWGEQERGGIALHFARLGLEAVADAFKRWTADEVNNQNLCYNIDKFKLFRRIAGGLTLKNVSASADNVAITDTPNRTISVNRVPDNTRQWVMTPNNLIHEMGHFMSRSAGFEFPKLGSIEFTLDPAVTSNSPAIGYTRDGMGPDYLRQQIIQDDYSTLYYQHANVLPDTTDPTLAVFSKIDLNAPSVAPSLYLLHDLLQDRYALWNSANNIYPFYDNKPATRIDIFVHNWPPVSQDDSTKLREITADSFLNWVRFSFEGTKGQDWLNFYQDGNRRIGKFMRNAVIYTLGMVQHYGSPSLAIIPQSPLDSGISVAGSNVRLMPDLAGASLIGGTDSLPTTVAIYGWLSLPVGTSLPDGSQYWLLLADQASRLVWVAELGIQHDPSWRTTQNEINPTPLDPSRSYTNTDLNVILGV